LESWSTVLSKVEVATDNFFLAKENSHFTAGRDQGKGKIICQRKALNYHNLAQLMEA
jgi:hypothetical protein